MNYNVQRKYFEIKETEKIRELYKNIHEKLTKIMNNNIKGYNVDLYNKRIPDEDIQYQLDYLLEHNG